MYISHNSYPLPLPTIPHPFYFIFILRSYFYMSSEVALLSIIDNSIFRITLACEYN